jgi:hypothetical protein
VQKPKRISAFVLTIAAFMTLAMSTASAKDKANGQDAADPPPNCSLNTLRGNYGYSFNGTVSPWGLLAGHGTLAFGSGGNLTGAYFENVNGLVFQGKFTGTFTVASDCTGSGTMAGLSHTWTVQLHFVIVDGGNEVLLLDTGASKVVSGIAKKM